jgi:hypothetical protein
MAYMREEVKNSKIRGLVERGDSYRFEVLTCDSANQVRLSTADRERIGSYLDSLQAYVADMDAEPEQDLPGLKDVHYPITYVCDDDTNTEIENPALKDIGTDLEDFCNLMATSQSSDQKRGMHAADRERADSFIDNMRRFMTDYVDNVQPLDLPNSTRSSKDASPGKR